MASKPPVDTSPIPSTLTALDTPGALVQLRQAVEVLNGFVGDGSFKAVTWNDLVTAGLASLTVLKFTGRGAPGTIAIPDPAEDPSPPPDATGLAVTAGMTMVNVETDVPTFTQGHGYQSMVVYGVQQDPSDMTTPVFGDAVEITEIFGALALGSFTSEADRKWSIWVKWKSNDGVLSLDPTGGLHGAQCTTGQDITHLLDALTAAALDPSSPYDIFAVRADLFYVGDSTDSDIPFFVATVPITNNGVTAPPGVYIQTAFIANGQIGTAQIGNAVVDTAQITNLAVTTGKIANLAVGDAQISDASVDKLTAGSVAVGEFIQSTGFTTGVTGWKIDGAGNAEFGAVSIRGQLTTGQIQVGAATQLANGNYSATGASIPAGTTYGSAFLSVFSATSHGSPVTLEGVASVVVQLANASVARVDVLLSPAIDSATITGSFAEFSEKTFTSGGSPTISFSVPIVVRSTPSAASHSYQIQMNFAFFDSSGSAISTAGSFDTQVYLVLTENLV